MSIGRVPGATGIQPSIVDAKGDIIAATAADSVSRLAVGTNNQVLTADSAEATGLKYANEARATLTTTGDLLYASAANTPARLAIGSTNQVLTVSGGVPTWATASSGAFTLLSTTTLSGSSTTITVSNTTYRHLFVDVVGVNPSANFHLYLGVNGGTTNHWSTTVQQWNGANNSASVGCAADKFNVNSATRFMKSGNTSNAFAIWIFEYTSSNTKNITCNGNYIEDSATSVFTVDTSGVCTDTATVSSLVFTCSTGTMSGGTVKVYGVK